jgi:hypothetical protein
VASPASIATPRPRVRRWNGSRSSSRTIFRSSERTTNVDARRVESPSSVE